MKFVKGIFKSPFDKRDFLVKSFLKEAIEPTEFDLTPKMSPVRSQGQEGSCAGFATAVGVKEFQERIDYSRPVSLSPRYIYELAKKISGHSEGTTLKACMQVISEKGVCEESLWPYIPNETNDPSPNADKNASKFKVVTYARVTNLNELKQALIQFGATLIGVNVYKGMVSEPCNSNGIVPNPSCWDRMNVLGGHAITACGYNNTSPFYKNDGHIKFKNSWGEDWGEKGYGYLSYKYIGSNMIDAFSCVDIDDPNPLTVASLSKKEKHWV